MKRLVSLLTVLAFVLVFSGSTFAQSATINANAEVITQIAVSETQAVDFGQISPTFTTNPSLNKTDNSTSGDIVSGSGAHVGLVSITGSNQDVILTLPSSSITLTHGTSDNRLNFTPDFGWTADAIAAGGTPSSVSDIPGDNTVAISGGEITLVVGGSLAPGANVGTQADAGSYTGTFDVSVDYSL